MGLEAEPVQLRLLRSSPIVNNSMDGNSTTSRAAI